MKVGMDLRTLSFIVIAEKRDYQTAIFSPMATIRHRGYLIDLYRLFNKG
jgi:hypothetical protein